MWLKKKKPSLFKGSYWSEVPKVRDEVRACGWRKVGGLYLKGGFFGMECGKLPLRLTVCPTCGEGIRFSRGPKFVQLDELFKAAECSMSTCEVCPLGEPSDTPTLLLWIGEQFYPTVYDYKREADRLGVSRRIKAVPAGFKLGETWVALAHVHGAPEFKGPLPLERHEARMVPAIFWIFKPTAIEYVCHGKEKLKDLQKLRARKITPVIVENYDQQEMDL